MENKTISILKWSVGILALLNILLLIFFTQNSMGQHGPPPRDKGEGGPQNMIIERLKLNEEQVKLFKELKEDHHAAIQTLQEKGKTLRTNYFNLLKTSTIDTLLKTNLSNEIATNQKSIELVTFDHFAELRKICTAEQQKLFDDIIDEVLMQMARPHINDGPPPPRHPH